MSEINYYEISSEEVYRVYDEDAHHQPSKLVRALRMLAHNARISLDTLKRKLEGDPFADE